MKKFHMSLVFRKRGKQKKERTWKNTTCKENIYSKISIYIYSYLNIKNSEIFVCDFLPKCNISTNTPLTKKETELPILPLPPPTKEKEKTRFLRDMTFFQSKNQHRNVRISPPIQGHHSCPQQEKIHITHQN